VADDADGIAALRATLDAAGYTAAAVNAALATEVAWGRDAANLPRYLGMLPSGKPLSALIKLFLLGARVAASEAVETLAPLSLARLEAMGVLKIRDGEVEAAIEIVPTPELILACDQSRHEFSRTDHVAGVSPPTYVLAYLTVRRRVKSALDIGTGSGVQALLAARHADDVVGVDINPRALRFAAFNAALNRVENVDWRLGNLFEPVRGSSFDLVVCNPPYVISPEAELVYRDAGVRADLFCEALVRRIPAFMHEGAFAHVLVSWIHPPQQDWSLPLRCWLEGSKCDAILLRYVTHDPQSYAALWNRHLRSNARGYSKTVDRWIAYYHEFGIEAISWGAIALRRRQGRNWVRAYTDPAKPMAGAGDQILRLFAAHDI
jgi:methylase of polypeptide subunit release factors